MIERQPEPRPSRPEAISQLMPMGLKRKGTAEPAQPCPVCDAPAAGTVARFGDYKDVNCPRCGEFMVSGTIATLLASMPRDTRRDSSRSHGVGLSRATSRSFATSDPRLLYPSAQLTPTSLLLSDDSRGVLVGAPLRL
jgi:hypothetical protein